MATSTRVNLDSRKALTQVPSMCGPAKGPGVERSNSVCLQTLRRERAGLERGPSIQSNTRTQPQSGSQLRTRPRRPLQGLNVEAPSAAQEPAHLTCFIMHRPPGRLSVKCLSLAGLAGHDLHVGLALVIALAAACSHQASSTTSARCGMRFVNGLAPAPVEAPGDAQQGHREDRCADDMLHG